jgi:hypothetical protein
MSAEAPVTARRKHAPTSAIALLTVGAFFLWLLFGAFVTGVRDDRTLERASETAPTEAPAP